MLYLFTILDEVTLPAAPHVVGNQQDVLHQILDPGVKLGLWNRPSQTAITRELSSLQPSYLPDVRRATSLDAFDDDVSALLLRQGLNPSAFKNWRADLCRLADIYFSISENRDVTMRLVTTEEDNCRRFHVDRTNLRLLCTYRGPGTEWLTNEQVDRFAQCTGAPNEDIMRFGEPSQFEPYWVGVKIDLISSAERERLEHALRQFNRHAEILYASFGKVPLEQVMGTGRFDFARAAQSPGWLASRPDFAGEWSQAGGVARHGPAGMRWAAAPREHWPQEPEYRARIEAEFKGEYGDRRQEIVFIGQNLDPDQTRVALDRCLLTDAEMAVGPEVWKRLDDPFPQWFAGRDES